MRLVKGGELTAGQYRPIPSDLFRPRAPLFPGFALEPGELSISRGTVSRGCRATVVVALVFSTVEEVRAAAEDVGGVGDYLERPAACTASVSYSRVRAQERVVEGSEMGARAPSTGCSSYRVLDRWSLRMYAARSWIFWTYAALHVAYSGYRIRATISAAR
jgi:hypothetical protein